MKNKVINICIAPETIDIFLSDINDYLDQNGFETFTMANNKEKLNKLCRLENRKNFFNHEISRKLNFIKELNSLFKIYKFFKKNKFDIIHLHTPKVLLLFSIIAKLSKNGKVVATYHGSLSKKNKYIRNFILFLIDYFNSFFIDYMFTVNSKDLKRFRKYFIYSDHKSSLLSISGVGVKADLFSIIDETNKSKLLEDLNIPIGSKIIGNVSRFNRNKGLDLLVDIVKQLNSELDFDIYLLHVGNIEDEEFFNSVNFDKLISIGYVDQVKLYKYYNLMDFFVFPSLREGFGISVGEANLCGVPAFVSDIKGLNEVVIDGVNGYKFKYKKDYINYIKDYLCNENKLNDLKNKTLEYAKNRFTQVEAKVNTLKVYKKLISEDI